jgi:hypothetical protein
VGGCAYKLITYVVGWRGRLGYSYDLIYSNLFKGYPSRDEVLKSPYVSPAWFGLSESDKGEESFERWPKTFILAGGGESKSVFAGLA